MKFRFFLLLLPILLAACGSQPPKPVADATATSSVAVAPAPTFPEKKTAPTYTLKRGGGFYQDDGPADDIPVDLASVPDAVPRAEPPHRFANRPYSVLGRDYTPLPPQSAYRQRGVASWYGRKFHGQKTSSGEPYDMFGMTAAHPTLPIPSYARVTRVNGGPDSGKSVVVRINDRGPFLHERVIDLSYTAAHKLGIISGGSAEVEVASLAPDIVITPVVAAERVTSTPLPPATMPPNAVAPAQDAVGGSNVYLQLGAFKTQEAAENFMAQMRTKLGGMGKQLSLFIKDGLTRIHLGPYADQNEARSNADSLQGKLGFKPLVSLR